MYTFIDLFAGIGGFRLALEKFGNECVFSSEIDPHCNKVHFENFGETPSGDITKINAVDIPNFDILAAGFPCQPFSYSGNLQGFKDQTRGTLFFDIARIIEEKKPKMFLLENVKGIVSHDKGKTLKTITTILEGLGYDIHYKVLNSYDFGVPQKRERWYCVGFDKTVNFEFPIGNNSGSLLRDIIDFELKDEALNLTDFENEIIDFHFSSNGERVFHPDYPSESASRKEKYGVYSYLKPDKNLRFHLGDTRKSQLQEAYFCSVDSVAPAIIATRAPKLWDLRRHLSVRESARLQGFPESFKFNVSNRQAKKQLGNSVTIPVVEKIVNNMINSYNK